MKKKNPIIINQTELTPTVIGKIEEKKSSIPFLIVLFVILIGFIIFLPNIISLINKYIFKVDDTLVSVNNNIINMETNNFICL